VTYDVINPATEQVIRTVEPTTGQQTDEAIARAAVAFESWRAVPAADRGRLLRRFADAVDADLDQLAALEVANAGHTWATPAGRQGNGRDVLRATTPPRPSG
jgi:acyl-CoA reductase-like NAD-dependent aldehyde dehydrogenase